MRQELYFILSTGVEPATTRLSTVDLYQLGYDSSLLSSARRRCRRAPIITLYIAGSASAQVVATALAEVVFAHAVAGGDDAPTRIAVVVLDEFDDIADGRDLLAEPGGRGAAGRAREA